MNGDSVQTPALAIVGVELDWIPGGRGRHAPIDAPLARLSHFFGCSKNRFVKQ